MSTKQLKTNLTTKIEDTTPLVTRIEENQCENSFNNSLDSSLQVPDIKDDIDSNIKDSTPKETQSYIIWNVDGLYAYAWGTSEEDALAQYLLNFRKSIHSIVPASNYADALPFHRYMSPPSNSTWDSPMELAPNSSLYDGNGKLYGQSERTR